MGLPAVKTVAVPTFPKRKVEDALRQWWREQEETSQRHGNPFSDAKIKKDGTVFEIQPQVSSQEAVCVLIDLEPLLGFEPSKSVIKRGGYKSCEEFVSETTSRVEKEFLKRNSH